MPNPIKAIVLPLDVAQALGNYLLRQPMGAVEAFVAAIRNAPLVDVNEPPAATDIAVPQGPPAAAPKLRAVPGGPHDMLDDAG
jgi:hypothetical protein